jgi:SAM-dependent methyltransferase
MESFVIKMLANDHYSEEYKKHFAISLDNNPAVLWYFVNKCPECADYFHHLIQLAPKNLTPDEIRRSELYIIKYNETSIVYAYPKEMDKLTYISGWDPERLLSITDFKDKKVLDLGSGTGRLAFAAAPYAKEVYACEPCERLRVYIKEKQKTLNIKNMYVTDGVIQAIPFENDMFDIVMAGHVIGDNYEQEYQELCRVLKNGGYIIDCPGEDERKRKGPSHDMIQLGFEYSHYVSKFGGDVYRYWKKIIK